MNHPRNFAREALQSLDKRLKLIRHVLRRDFPADHAKRQRLECERTHRQQTGWIEQAEHFCAPDFPRQAFDDVLWGDEGTDPHGLNIFTAPYDTFTLSYLDGLRGGQSRKHLLLFVKRGDGVLILPFVECIGYGIELCMWGGIQTLKVPTWPSKFELMDSTIHPETDGERIEEKLAHQACVTGAMFMAYLELPNLHSTEDPIIIPGYTPPLSKLDRLRGKKPEYPHKVLAIRKPAVIATPLPGTGTSGWRMREHKRRGHIRRLRSGRVVTVKPCVAGDPTLGVVEKDYALETS